MWLCPTKLAITMAGGAAGRMAAADDGFIIVETNYRRGSAACAFLGCRGSEPPGAPV